MKTNHIPNKYNNQCLFSVIYMWQYQFCSNLALVIKVFDISLIFTLCYRPPELIIDDPHDRRSAPFCIKTNQPCFLHLPKRIVLRIAADSPLHAVLSSNLHGPRCPSLTIMTPKLLPVCLPPDDNSNHTCSSRDSRSFLEPFQWQRTSDKFLVLPRIQDSFVARIKLHNI